LLAQGELVGLAAVLGAAVKSNIESDAIGAQQAEKNTNKAVLRGVLTIFNCQLV
jgi:hypothetical protein